MGYRVVPERNTEAVRLGAGASHFMWQPPTRPNPSSRDDASCRTGLSCDAQQISQNETCLPQDVVVQSTQQEIKRATLNESLLIK